MKMSLSVHPGDVQSRSLLVLAFCGCACIVPGRCSPSAECQWAASLDGPPLLSACAACSLHSPICSVHICIYVFGVCSAP